MNSLGAAIGSVSTQFISIMEQRKENTNGDRKNSTV
jgi:hypothetical protein